MCILVAVHVRVDEEKCQGHNRCVALAPQLFETDDYGTAHVLDGGVVPAELEGRARLAVANCPEFAVTISDD